MLSIVAESVYFPTNNATGFPLLHIISKFFDDNHADSLWSHGLYSLWNSPGQNTTVGSHSLLQGIFPIQEVNLGLPHCRQILYHLSHQGKVSLLEKSIYILLTLIYNLNTSSFHVSMWPFLLIFIVAYQCIPGWTNNKYTYRARCICTKCSFPSL